VLTIGIDVRLMNDTIYIWGACDTN